MFPREWGLFKWNYSGGRLHLAGLQERNVFFFFLKNAGLIGGATGAPPGVCVPVFFIHVPRFGGLRTCFRKGLLN